MSEQAKRAYDKYVTTIMTESARLTPSSCPKWDELPTLLQDAWRAALVAAVETPSPKPFVREQLVVVDEPGKIGIHFVRRLQKAARAEAEAAVLDSLRAEKRRRCPHMSEEQVEAAIRRAVERAGPL